MDDATPERMSLVNLANGAQLDAQFNPEELQESIGAVYAKQAVLGYSHQVKQFVHTEDLGVTFTLYFSSFDGPDRHKLNMAARRFLHAACYPRALGAGTLAHAGAPRVLFVWPELVSLTCVVTKVAFTHRRFRRAGAPVVFAAAVSIEEIRDAFIGMEDVFAVGTERPPGRGAAGVRYGGEF